MHRRLVNVASQMVLSNNNSATTVCLELAENSAPPTIQRVTMHLAALRQLQLQLWLLLSQHVYWLFQHLSSYSLYYRFVYIYKYRRLVFFLSLSLEFLFSSVIFTSFGYWKKLSHIGFRYNRYTIMRHWWCEIYLCEFCVCNMKTR